MCAVVARSPHQIDVEFLSKGLHDLGGAAMRAKLQDLVDAVPPDSYDAVLLGYALCGNGLAGLAARTLPLIAPRAHDCIALLMGSRQRYAAYFEGHSGAYYRSPGWLERGENLVQDTMHTVRDHTGAGYTLEALIEKYGEDSGRYLFDEFSAYQRHYRQITYIATGVEPDASFEQRAREEAARRGWDFEIVQGGLGIFERLVRGEWDSEDFVTVPPGWRIVHTFDDRIIDREPAP
jgi:hypothetical protein